MERKPAEEPIFSARRQRYTVSPVNDKLVAALVRQFQMHKPAPQPMELRLLAQQLVVNHPSVDLSKPQEIRRLAETGYRMIVPYSYKHLQEKVLPAYDTMKDLEAIAARLADAIQHGEQIGISGDYDCDGNCSTALMIRLLQESGVPADRIHVHIPNRVKEGYGVNTAAIEDMATRNPPVTFLMTLDNGTTANKPIAVAKDKNMDVAVIDHHPNSDGQALPPGALVVNPRRSDESAAIAGDPSGAPDLAAVGVTWLVARRAAQILEARGHFDRLKESNPQFKAPDPRRWLGLVAMATIGDVVSLRKPLNHALVCEGLKVIREDGDPYITALARVAGLRNPNIEHLSESDIAFKLAPIINAPGRLGQSVAWAFLSAPDATAEPIEPLLQALEDSNQSLANSIERFNEKKLPREKIRLPKKREAPSSPVPVFVSTLQYALMMNSDLANDRRKEIAAEVNRLAQKQARSMLRDNPNLGTLLLAGDDWHEGVVGIVAGRIKEEFGLPTIVASINRERGLCKASARNILGGCGDIGQVLRDMSKKEDESLNTGDEVISKAGGHPMAAGASFDAANLDAVRAKFEERLGDKARAIRATKQAPLAATINLSEAIGKGKAAQTPMQLLQQFANAQEFTRPHGQGREKPRIGLYGGAITSVGTTSSSGQHLQFMIQIPGSYQHTLECRAFHSGGSKLDARLREASMPNSGDTFPLLIGTLEQPPRGQGTTNTLTFFIEDILFVSPHKKARKDAVADALCSDSNTVCPIVMGRQSSVFQTNHLAGASGKRGSGGWAASR
jgi:single-stranded-DNA-specific exonuclease